MKKRIIIAGIYRSGSTWVYNVVRLICEQYGTVYPCFYDEDAPDNYDRNDPADFHVIKMHKYRHDTAMKLVDDNTIVLTSIRSIRGIVDSMNRLKDRGMSGNYTQSHRMGEYMSWWGYWMGHVKPMKTEEGLLAGCVEFGRMLETPLKVIREISEYIGLKCREPDINDQVNRLEEPEQGRDPVTLLHFNHKTENYTHVLREEEINDYTEEE